MADERPVGYVDSTYPIDLPSNDGSAENMNSSPPGIGQTGFIESTSSGLYCYLGCLEDSTGSFVFPLIFCLGDVTVKVRTTWRLVTPKLVGIWTDRSG
jgi:hypothetical protein